MHVQASKNLANSLLAAAGTAPAPAVSAAIGPVESSELTTRKQAADALLAHAQALPVMCNADVEKCAEILKDVKIRQEWLEAASESVLKPMREAEKAARAMFADHQKPLATIREVLRQKVAAYAEALKTVRKELEAGMAAGTVSQAQLAQTEMPSFDGLSLSEVWDVEVLDIEIVTPMYVEKTLNRVLVLDHARQAEGLGRKLEVPGLKVFKKPQVNVRTKPRTKKGETAA